MVGEEPRRVVVDACILINFLNVDQLDVLEALAGFEFIVTEHVVDEIERHEQRAVLEASIGEERIEQITVKNEAALRIFGELEDHIGDGEAACIALAQTRGWEVATDEQRRAKKEATSRLSQAPLTTPDLIIKAIQQDLLTVEQADAIKRDLEENHRFKMAFDSFGMFFGSEW